MDKKFISIRNAAAHPERGDRRCKRSACIFPVPIVQFDLEGRHIVAVWSWVGVRTITVANGVRIRVMPSMLLVAFSCS